VVHQLLHSYEESVLKNPAAIQDRHIKKPPIFGKNETPRRGIRREISQRVHDFWDMMLLTSQRTPFQISSALSSAFSAPLRFDENI